MKGIAALNDWIAIAGSIPMLVDLVPKGIIHSVVSGSAQTWFIIYFYYWNLQFLHNAVIKTKVFFPQEWTTVTLDEFVYSI